MIEVYVFLMGLILGSFFNVVGLRRPVKESIVKPASHCPDCKHELKWYDLIPVISYVMCLGKCRYCKKKIPIYYLLIELLCGTLFLVGYITYGFGYEFLTFITISSLLIIIFVSDFKYMIILDGPLVICLALIYILRFYFIGIRDASLALISGLIIFAITYFFRLVCNFIFKKDTLGGGDIKLGLFIGTVLGLRLSLACWIIASMVAFPYAIYVSLFAKNKELPFGPFLISAVLITFYFTPQIELFFKIISHAALLAN